MYHKPLKSKSNHKHLVSFDNHQNYAVHFLHAGNEKSLMNEWIAYCIAKYMEIPVPEVQIIEMPNIFLEEIPNLNAYYQHDLSKKQSAILYLEETIPLNEAEARHIINVDDIAKMIVFDYWLCNTNRTHHNVLLKYETPGVYHCWIMDHSEIFSSISWTAADLESLPETLLQNVTHETLANFIPNEREFIEQIKVIQTIPSLLLEEILSLIPEEWKLSEKEQKNVLKTLNYRRYKVIPRVINQFINEIYSPLVKNRK
ncbi:HipA family kinase [Chengkuizengella sp. SCS-71B]|uniref:HipA family kinase n=1 Tax=Chengkuizengella sp. SCS-71B TaxID=3115290 RepID=UPI0032C2307E